MGYLKRGWMAKWKTIVRWCLLFPNSTFLMMCWQSLYHVCSWSWFFMAAQSPQWILLLLCCQVLLWQSKLVPWVSQACQGDEFVRATTFRDVCLCRPPHALSLPLLLLSPRLTLCLAPDRIPGVSIMLILSRTWLGIWAHWNLFLFYRQTREKSDKRLMSSHRSAVFEALFAYKERIWSAWKMVNSYQRSQCDLRGRLETTLSTPPNPSCWRPLCTSWPLVAVGFLRENDHYCQNQTIRPANDVWLRTTTPLPVVYELNEPTGSENRKSRQEERRNYVREHTLQRDSAGKLAPETSHRSPRNSGTVSSYHVGAACPRFQQLTELYCKTFDFFLGLHQWKIVHRNLAARTVNRAEERTWMFLLQVP